MAAADEHDGSVVSMTTVLQALRPEVIRHNWQQQISGTAASLRASDMSESGRQA